MDNVASDYKKIEITLASTITKRDKPRRFLFFPHPRICVNFRGCVNHNPLIALTSHSLALLLARIAFLLDN